MSDDEKEDVQPYNQTLDSSAGAAALLEGHMYRVTEGNDKVPTPSFTRPMGDRTTVLDIADRDEMDDNLFPLTAKDSFFTRDPSLRTLPFAMSLQEFVYKGTASFGGTFVFEIGSVNACDILQSVSFQIRLGHWFSQDILNSIEKGILTYADPNHAWTYANSLGTILIQKAQFMLDDQVLETIDGDFTNVVSLLFPDVNEQFGAGRDAYGRWSIPELIDFSTNITRYPSFANFPTSNGMITCILPFSFQRMKLRGGFPLISCKAGTVRVQITLRPFSECVRRLNETRDFCNQTPLGLSFVFNIQGGGTETVVASTVVPAFQDARLVTYGIMTDGKLRTALLRAPFDRLYREVSAFMFDEPKKYVVNTGVGGTVSLQLPLEINNPVEEILWIVRRKAVSLNNEWTNYSSVIESEYNLQYNPFQSMLINASIQVNGENFVEGNERYFRREIAQAHRGGIVPYNQFVYGYSFAKRPGKQDPTGWFNASRATDVRLRLQVSPPTALTNSDDLAFEVFVWVIGMNWVRFENGIANRVFSS
jgi:hypothetical protein